MPEDMTPKEKERLKKALSNLPELSTVSVGELQTVARQVGKPAPALTFFAKLSTDILRDIRGNLIKIKDIMTTSIKPFVKTVEKKEVEDKDSTIGGVTKGLFAFTMLQNLIRGGLSGAIRGVTGLLGKAMTALGPFGIAIGVIALSAAGLGLLFKSLRDKALAFGESLKDISPSMAAIQAQREIAERLRGMRIGAAIAPEQQELIQSMIRLNNSTEGIRIISQKIYAEFGIVFNEVLATLVEFSTEKVASLFELLSDIPLFGEMFEEMAEILKGMSEKELKDRGIPRQIAEALASGKWWERQIHLSPKLGAGGMAPIGPPPRIE